MKRLRLLLLAAFAALCLTGLIQTAPAGVVPDGDVDPFNPTSWTNTTRAYIGKTGTGSVLVNGANTITSWYGYIGWGSDAIGTMTVSGTDSLWTNTADLYVGDEGDGTLEIDDDGTVNNLNCSSYIGNGSGSTGLATVDGDDSLWNNGNNLFVGYSGQGTLEITGGGTVNNTHGYIGYYPCGLLNQATVSDASSTWDNDNALTVARYGTATLDILNGGRVESTLGYVGHYSSSTGTVTIDGANSTWDNSSSFFLGVEENATGTLTLTNGGSLTNGYDLYVGFGGGGTLEIGAGCTVDNTGSGYIGHQTEWGIEAKATVSGAGSTWSNGGDLHVGYEGYGTLEITGGGVVGNTVGYIGRNTYGNGEVTISGTDSTWTNTSDLFVGNNGYGKLDIAAGGTVENAAGHIGYSKGRLGEVTVDGTNSTWTNSGKLYVGQSGYGTLDITGGASVSNTQATIADGYDSTGEVTVDGQNSTWTNSSVLTVGGAGDGTLAITNRGTVSCVSYATIGSWAAATGLVTVDGDGSTFTVDGTLYVSSYGPGTLQITGGADVSSKGCSIADHIGSIGAVTVRGAGSTWTAGSYTLYVGLAGNGTLLVDQQGTVTSGGDTYIGYGATAMGQATVDGAGSTWTQDGSLYVGYGGSGTLNVTNNSAVTIAKSTYVGYEPDSTAAIGFGSSGGVLTTRSLFVSPSQLSGTGTIDTRGLVSDVALVFNSTSSLTQTLTLGGVAVNLDLATDPATNGDLGAGWRATGSLSVQGGVTVQSAEGYLGYVAGSTGQATVTGTDSTWTNSGNLYVGYSGSGLLAITAGGAVGNNKGYIGSNSGSTGQVTVDGTDSTWTNSGMLYVGEDGPGTLQITNGGAVSNTSSDITDGEVTVDGKSSTTGTASTWTTTGILTIGGSANSHGILTITNGGAVSNSSYGRIGSNSSKATGRGSIDGTGSTWTNSSSLYVAGYGHATLEITGGGAVGNTYGYVASQTCGTAEVTVTGTDSTWTNSGKLYFAQYGTATLEIADGGTVANTDGYLAYGAAATGQVLVTDTSSTWTNNGALAVGYDGAARLALSDGGNVSATGVSINSQSLLAIEVNDGSLLNVGAGAGTITNDGTVRAIAGPTPTAGTPYAPIAAGTWDSSGTYQAVGGTWDATGHTLTPSSVATGSSGTPVSIDLATQQRVLIDDGGNATIDWNVGVSFLKAGSSTTLNFTATVIDGETLDDLQDYLDPGDVVLGAWDFAAPGYGVNDPAYVSFDVGPGCSRDDLQIWHYDGEDWTQFDTWDLTYDGTYVSFTPEGFSGYAVTPFKNVWIPGDCDGDNRVDEEDAATLADHWGEEGRWADGDFNGDGIVNAIDASILAANWCPAGPGNEQGSTMPEPGSVVLLLGLSLMAALTQRRHRA